MTGLVRWLNRWWLLLIFLSFSNWVIGQYHIDSLSQAFTTLPDSEARLLTLIELLEQDDTTDITNRLIIGDRLGEHFAEPPVKLEWLLYHSIFEINRGDYEAGYALSIEALQLAKLLNARSDQATAAYRAAFAISEYDYPASLFYYEECIALSRAEGDSLRLADCLIDYTDAYASVHGVNNDIIPALLKEARLISAALKLGEQRVTNYIHHVEYFLKTDKMTTARNYLRDLKILTDSLKTDEPYFESDYLKTKADVMITAGEPDLAIALKERALRIELAEEELANLEESYEELLELYEQFGRYRQAYELLSEYSDYREKGFSREKRLMVSRLDRQYRNVEKEALIADQNIALRLARQRTFFLIAAILIFGGLLLLVFLQSRRIRSSNAELSALSAAAHVQNDKLNTLLGELHHRVKNNLQLISSLLRLQARKTSDHSVKSALSVGQRRVEAMSIIHQRLYQQENLTVVDLQSVFSELVQRTDFAYRPGLIPVKTNIQLDVRHLDATHAVPLTLIVNELATNSFKYAFTELLVPGITMRLVCLPSGKLRFSYSDNGPGFKENSQPSAGFGTQLINSLSGQLGGSNEFRSDDQGAHFELIFRVSTPSRETGDQRS